MVEQVTQFKTYDGKVFAIESDAEHCTGLILIWLKFRLDIGLLNRYNCPII